MFQSTVTISTQLEGFHCYPKAMGRHAHLANRHRHVFHIDIEMSVNQLDREIEFIDAKEDITELIKTGFPNAVEMHGCDFETMSCETIAKWIIDNILSEKYGNRDYTVSVKEDNENGARLHTAFGELV